MRLILIRHADAGDPDPQRYPDDGARPLTPGGAHEQQVVGRALARMGLRPTHLLTSPLRRARETAEISARALGWSGAIEPVETLGERFSLTGLLEQLARYPDDAVVVCVGHEPHLSRLAATLLHTDGTVRIGLSKSGVIALECAGAPAPGTARLLFMLPPRELLRLMAQEESSEMDRAPRVTGHHG